MTTVRKIAEETIWFKKGHHRHWFDEIQLEILTLLNRKNKAHDGSLANPSSGYLRSVYCELQSTVHSELRRIKYMWLVKLGGQDPELRRYKRRIQSL